MITIHTDEPDPFLIRPTFHTPKRVDPSTGQEEGLGRVVQPDPQTLDCKVLEYYSEADVEESEWRWSDQQSDLEWQWLFKILPWSTLGLFRSATLYVRSATYRKEWKENSCEPGVEIESKPPYLVKATDWKAVKTVTQQWGFLNKPGQGATQDVYINLFHWEDRPKKPAKIEEPEEPPVAPQDEWEIVEEEPRLVEIRATGVERSDRDEEVLLNKGIGFGRRDQIVLDSSVGETVSSEDFKAMNRFNNYSPSIPLSDWKTGTIVSAEFTPIKGMGSKVLQNGDIQTTITYGQYRILVDISEKKKIYRNGERVWPVREGARSFNPYMD